MYGQMVDPHSPAFQQVTTNLAHFSQHAVGGTVGVSAMRANALVATNIVQQAFVQAINDDFLVAAGITALTLVPIFLLRTHRQRAKKKGQQAAME